MATWTTKEDAYKDGLLTAQKMANQLSADALLEGRTDASNALAELSTDICMLRGEVMHGTGR